MDRFEKTEMKKIKPIKNTWYNWLINYIPEPTTRQTHLRKLCLGEERN